MVRYAAMTPRIRVAVFYVGLALAYGWPLVFSISDHLPSDIGDPGLNTWILWWNSQAVPCTERWWNAPMFYPAPGAFAFSEALLSVAPIAILLHRLGAPPVAVHNIIFLASIPAAAIAAHALARYLTGRQDAAMIAGVAFGFSPYRVAQLPHLQMELACFMPLTLLALHKYVDDRRSRYLIIAGTCWLLNGLTSGYFLMFFAVLLALWLIWFVKSWVNLVNITAALIVFSLPLLPLLSGYHRYQSAIGVARTIREIESFSADLTSIWSASPFVSLSSYWTLRPKPEGELYPGIVVLGIIAFGALIAWRREGLAQNLQFRRYLFLAAGVTGILAAICLLTGGTEFTVLNFKVSLTRPHKIVTVSLWILLLAVLCDRRILEGWRRRSPFLFYGLAAFAMFAFALGPVGRFMGERFLYNAPYFWLTKLPGGDALRVPARFAMLFVLCLSQAAALSLSRFARTDSRRTVAALTALILLDGWVIRMPTAATPRAVDLTGTDPRAIVIELPVIDEYSATAALLRATSHHHPVANGYSGYGPPHQVIFENGLRDLDPSILSAFQVKGPVLVFVAKDRDVDGAAKGFMDQVSDAEHVQTSTAGDLYRLPERGEQNDLTGSRALSLRSIDVPNSPSFNSGFLHDGNVNTRWEAPADGKPGDQIILALNEPAAIDAVEMDLGPYRLGYPPKLRVEVGDGLTLPHTVWEGRTAGLAMLGVMTNYKTATITIDLPPRTVGRQVMLTLIEKHKTLSWSVGEIRLIGK